MTSQLYSVGTILKSKLGSYFKLEDLLEFTQQSNGEIDLLYRAEHLATKQDVRISIRMNAQGNFREASQEELEKLSIV